MTSRHVAVVVRWPTGGIRTYLKYVYPTVLRGGWRATFVMPEVDGANQIRADLSEFSCDFETVGKEGAARDLAGGLWRLLRRCKPQVVHSHGLTAALLCEPVARFYSVPHVATLHDIFREDQFSGLKGELKRLLTQSVLGSVDHIQCVSNDARENLLACMPRAQSRRNRVYAVPNGIKSELFADACARNLRAELGVDQSTCLIGFLGRFMNQKGFRLLVHAMEQLLSEGNLERTPVVVAFGGGGFVREDQALVRSKGLAPSFRFLPFVSNVADTLKGLDVVAMPSLWEAGPILAMEALAAGVPLIGTSCIGLRETLADTCATVIAPGNAEQLSAALREFMRDPEAYRQRAAAFAPEARRRFDVARTAEMVLESLEKLHDVRRPVGTGR